MEIKISELEHLKTIIDTYSERAFKELGITKEELSVKYNRCIEVINSLTTRDLMTLWYINQTHSSIMFYSAAKKRYEVCQEYSALTASI